MEIKDKGENQSETALKIKKKQFLFRFIIFSVLSVKAYYNCCKLHVPTVTDLKVSLNVLVIRGVPEYPLWH